ncbi:MAG: exosome complex protein Rrp42 [Candidatus Diapherotrites archaeon]|uniref:Exosome complex protein Rrp42 n=1 Tax=Candidatus Iainarchaeum sp. TaxID=3101447 RepID=A0A8T4C7C6_9ARCH|nr:exosome complex protein Rrp42 [Candidatus Diapherotrites archaeon]
MGHMDILMELQRNKVLESLKQGKRVSNRAFDEYRNVEVITNVSENANGSARVKLGKTDVIAGTKFGIQEPFPDTPNEGSISVGAELTPLASPLNEVGPPSTSEVELARVVDRGIRESHCIDLESLCITEGEKVLSLYVDVYAVNDDGNMFDAASMAALAALNTTRMSKVEDGAIVYGEYDGMLKLANQPLLSTTYKVGNHLLADADLGEEKAMTARFSFGGTEKGVLTAFQKGGSGSFTLEELEKSVEMGLKNAKMLRKLLKG